MMHLNNCPLCKASRIRPFLACRDNLVTKKEFILSRCDNCDFIFTRDYPEEYEAHKYYESDNYFSHNDKGKSLFERLYRVVRSIMLTRKKNIITRATRLKKGTLLDIGSGTGWFLNTMKKTGWQADGVEINSKAREQSISDFAVDVIVPRDISKLESGIYDCITMWHVLEHLYNPENYFNEIRRLLKPSGRLVIALPNAASFDAEFYGKDWAAWDLPRHLWHFTPNTFTLFAGMAGMKVTGMAALPFDVFYISMLSERNRLSPAADIKGFFRGLFYSAASSFNMSRSSSLVYILEPSRD